MNTELFQNGLTISSDTVTWGSDLWHVADFKRVWIEPAGESDGDGLKPKGSVDLPRQAILTGIGIGAFSGFRSSTPWIGLIFLASGDWPISPIQPSEPSSGRIPQLSAYRLEFGRQLSW